MHAYGTRNVRLTTRGACSQRSGRHHFQAKLREAQGLNIAYLLRHHLSASSTQHTAAGVPHVPLSLHSYWWLTVPMLLRPHITNRRTLLIQPSRARHWQQFIEPSSGPIVLRATLCVQNARPAVADVVYRVCGAGACALRAIRVRFSSGTQLSGTARNPEPFKFRQKE